MKRKSFLRALETGASIVLGNAILAFAIVAFVIPHDIIMGGVTGIAILINRFSGTDIAVLVLILNLLSLLLGAVVLGKKMVLTTIASTVLYPVLLGLIQRIPNVTHFTGDPLLATLFAGVLIGLSVGMVMRVGASTGGTDILNLVLHKWFHLPVSVFLYLCDIVILGGQAIFSEPEEILYGIVLLVLETIILDRVMLLGQSQVQVFAISGKYEELRQKFLVELEAGVTMVLIETGMNGEERKGILCVLPPRKLHDAKELIHETDPEAFITVTQIKEVKGRGFSLDKQ